MERINVAELLKDCPKGMELDCVVYDNLTFDYINEEQGGIYCKVEGRDTVWFTIYGCVNHSKSSKCVIFPKGKTTWEDFQRPFKDGDIVSTGGGRWLGIVERFDRKNYYKTHVVLREDSLLYGIELCFCRLATEEEKQKLFDAIKDNGYKWNDETKTLEKLKVEKFDITTLKPFESRVLVRDNTGECWCPAIFGCKIKCSKYPFFAMNGCAYKQCIPCELNEHLLGTTDDCDEYYKTWEE